MTSIQSAFVVIQLCHALSGEAENTNVIVAGFT